jgi:putative FmdB family regulatory protein
MPTYEYACRECGENIEIFQSFSDKPLKTHDECGGELKKIFHARGIVFKGSGFYATGNRSSGSLKPSEKSDTSTKTSSKSDAKSQSKPKASSTTSKDS